VGVLFCIVAHYLLCYQLLFLKTMNPSPPPTARIAITTIAIISPIFDPSSSVTGDGGTGVGVFAGVAVGSGAVITGTAVAGAGGFGVAVAGTAVGGAAVGAVFGVAVGAMAVGAVTGVGLGVAVGGTAVAGALGLDVAVGGTAVAGAATSSFFTEVSFTVITAGTFVGVGAEPTEKLPNSCSILTSYLPTGLFKLNVTVSEPFAAIDKTFDSSIVLSIHTLAGYT